MTVLFADLVGFTTLSEDRDPEAVKQIVDGAFERLAADVRSHGGRVDKIVGDAIVALFGAPLAHEDDAERAVRSGLAMLETLAAFSDEEGLDLQLRVGVNTGEVLVGALRAGGDYTAMGDVVNLASRIQTMASPGEVMVGHTTHDASAGSIEYESRGDLSARGRSREEAVWVATGVFGAPGREHRGVDTPLFGRDTETALLVNAAVGSIRHRRGQLMLLVGEAGVGKSRLASEVAEHLRIAERASCFSGRCVPYGEANPWWPVAEILRSALEISPGDSTADVERRARDAVRGVLGGESAQVDVVLEGLLHILGHEGTFEGVEGAQARAGASRALRTYLEGLLSKGPLLVRIADLHWADDAILELIDDLAENLARHPVILIATARRALLSRWTPSPGRSNNILLNVDPLDRGAELALLEHLVEAPVDERSADQLLDRSGGNPLYLEELVTLVGSSERTVAPSEGEGAVPSLPATLQGVVAARIDALSTEEQDVLGEAAIWGGHGRVDVLERMAQVSRGAPSVAPVIRSLSDKDVLVLADGRWEFRSDLVREVTYARLTKAARLRGHAGIAQYMDQRYSVATADDPTVEVVARHFAEAADLAREMAPERRAEMTDGAVRWLGESARRAERGGAFAFGARMNQRTLDLLDDDDPTRVSALLGLSRCQAELWRGDEAAHSADQVLSIARRSGDGAHEAEALLALAVAEMRSGRWAHCDELLDAALEIQKARGDTAAVGEVYRQMALASLLRGDHRSAERPVRRALESFREVGDVRGEGWALQSLAWIAFGDGRLDEAHDRIDESAVALESVADRGGLLWTRGLNAFVCLASGHLGEASKIAAEVLAVAEQRGDRFAIGMMNLALGGVELWTGRSEEAVASAEIALENLDRRTDLIGMEQALALHGRALVITGRIDEGFGSLERALELGGQTTMGVSEMVVLLTEVQLGLPGRVLDELPAEGTVPVRALWCIQHGDLDAGAAIIAGGADPTAQAAIGDAVAAAIVSATLEGPQQASPAIESIRSDPAATHYDRMNALIVESLLGPPDSGAPIIASARAELADTGDRVSPALITLADAIRGGQGATPMAQATGELDALGLGATRWREVFSAIASWARD